MRHNGLMEGEFKPAYSCKVAVRWGDCDSLRHLNNAKYFTFTEEARIQWLYSTGILKPGRTEGIILVATEMNFLKPILYPATAEIQLLIGGAGRSSFVVKHEILVDSVPHARGSSTLVWIDYASGKSIPLPQSLVDLIPPKTN